MSKTIVWHDGAFQTAVLDPPSIEHKRLELGQRRQAYIVFDSKDSLSGFSQSGGTWMHTYDTTEDINWRIKLMMWHFLESDLQVRSQHRRDVCSTRNSLREMELKNEKLQEQFASLQQLAADQAEQRIQILGLKQENINLRRMMESVLTSQQAGKNKQAVLQESPVEFPASMPPSTIQPIQAVGHRQAASTTAPLFTDVYIGENCPAHVGNDRLLQAVPATETCGVDNSCHEPDQGENLHIDGSGSTCRTGHCESSFSQQQENGQPQQLHRQREKCASGETQQEREGDARGELQRELYSEVPEAEGVARGDLQREEYSEEMDEEKASVTEMDEEGFLFKSEYPDNAFARRAVIKIINDMARKLGRPSTERKKIYNQYLLAWHPDKSGQGSAQGKNIGSADVLQFIYRRREWFTQ